MLCCFPLLQSINDALVCWLAWPTTLGAPRDKHNWRWWDFLWIQTLVYTDPNLSGKHWSTRSRLALCLQIRLSCICSEPAGTNTATRPLRAAEILCSSLGQQPLPAQKVSWSEKEEEIAEINMIFHPKEHFCIQQKRKLKWWQQINLRLRVVRLRGFEEPHVRCVLWCLSAWIHLLCPTCGSSGASWRTRSVHLGRAPELQALPRLAPPRWGVEEGWPGRHCHASN